MKFTKKPAVVEAFQVGGAIGRMKFDGKGLPPWILASHEKGDIAFYENSAVVRGLVGDAHDWIVRESDGNITVVKAGEFENNYERSGG